ncbi:GNAT family N-acetyltransferase [Falsiroseomonas selenitidurans]|uniref:GNAT family N-acetyltransferase n=1 Tax=Falsiroseomonas selenitidurans TaxID=2716335 RepID=A0ABX1E974_9PROT|nr:GNAT family N-acetyltransferase [Falsiroseomonas selenitidurans]NKC32348.1 GNAT family N-acetyltransferase [Falsiroseomonas selenitidurans]OYW10770.1 MAG: GNAT family N-acetyltransferase [Rhodospirillales bacterium 12-71-4]
MSTLRAGTHDMGVELITAISPHDLAELCEATNAAIIDGGGFGWVQSQDRAALARHFRGVLLVPDRTLFIARLDGIVVGSAQLVRPPRNNEAQAFAAQVTHAYIAPYARGFGLARQLIRRVEEHAAGIGLRVLNLDVRETQESAIALFEGLGYIRWGTHPAYARVDGRTVAGHFYHKLLEPGRGRSTDSLIGLR